MIDLDDVGGSDTCGTRFLKAMPSALRRAQIGDSRTVQLFGAGSARGANNYTNVPATVSVGSTVTAAPC
jgi:hypothetical protein